jgi:predicted nucleotidyltransferase
MKPSVSMAKHRDRVRRILDRFRMGNPKAFGSAARRESTAKPSSRKH